MWAEHQLTQARLAIEAQTEIDREQQRRRVVEALEAPGARPGCVGAYLRARGGRHVPADRRRSGGSKPGSRRIACCSRATRRSTPSRTCRHTSSQAGEVEPHD